MYRLHALFFLSGAAGLVYQVVWSSLLHRVFGVTVYAVTTVLATFLGGLALGGFVVGRMADRQRLPLRLYGWLEIGIALSAVAGLGTIRVLEPVHMWAADRYAPDSAALISIRALLGALVVLPPTFLMGGTLPVITRAVVSQIRSLGRELSLLYALNTLGAVSGSLAAGFLLVRWLGLHGTLAVAVGANLVAGLLALAWAAGTHVQPVVTIAPSAAPAGSARRRGDVGLLLVIGVCGFVTLGLEILWTRVLMLSVGTTTYAFVTMLSSFLIGITLGSVVARLVVDRVGNLRRLVGWAQLGIAASTLASLPLVNAGVTQRWLTGWGADWLALIALRFGVSLLIMLVPTVLIGMTFPLVARQWIRQMPALGESLGQIYGANAFGNVAGAVLTGFVLLPWVGLQKGIVVLAVLSLANAGWGFAARREGAVERSAQLRALPVVAGVALCVVLLAAWQPRPFGVWGEEESDETLYYREGVVSTVKVIQKARGPHQRWMAVDAVKIGESRDGVDVKQQALAHFPFLLRAENPPREILSIGLGTGIVVGEAANHAGVASVDCLEISPAVIEAAKWFEPYNHGALNNPAIRVINDDGVNFLRRTDRLYDAVISDAKSRTTHAANALFFSQDYYRLCHEHLAPDGLMLQWVPLSVPAAEMRTILRTFVSVFPRVYVWVIPPHSCFLVGVNEPLELDLREVNRVLLEPATAGLRGYGFDSAQGFLGMLTADRDSLQRWLATEAEINTIEHPVLEFYSPRAHAVPPAKRRDENLTGLHPRETDPRRRLTLRNADTGALQISLTAAAHVGQALDLLEQGDPGEVSRVADLLHEALALAPFEPVLNETVCSAFRLALKVDPDHFHSHMSLGDLLRSGGRLREAARHYREAVRLRPDGARARRNLGLVLRVSGRLDPALEQLRRAEEIQPGVPATLAGLAYILATHPDATVREPDEALRLALRARALTVTPDALILDALASAYAATGNFEQAVRTAQAALRLTSNSGTGNLHAQINHRLGLYRQQRPYRETLRR